MDSFSVNIQDDQSDSVLAIIGTAGNAKDFPNLNLDLYDQMYEQTLGVIDEWKITHAVSGGAAYADHLAVRAFLENKVERLTLFSPAYWKNSQFVPNYKIPSNPGSVANKRHFNFSQMIEKDTLKDIELAVQKGATFKVFEGFKLRNTEVAEIATHMIAFTFGQNRAPEDLLPNQEKFSNHSLAGLKDGGTADTWTKAWKCSIKRHISLNWLQKEINEKQSFKI